MRLMNLLMLPVVFLSAAACCGRSENIDLTGYVDPNIGTVHSRWFFYTPAAEPFGLAKLGASTNGTYGNKDGWEAVGYEDTHTSIDGFPCVHEFQVGGISLMPVTGDVKTVPGPLEDPDSGFRSRFDKETEDARPGYYSVVLKDYDVKVELTATARTGFQRYTFPASEKSHILFNIGNRQGESGNVKDAYIECSGNVVSGYVITEPEYIKRYQAGASLPVYFYAVLDRAPESVGVFRYGSGISEADEIRGSGAVMSLDYSTEEGDVVTVKIGLSYTSVENAEKNMLAEAADASFDDVMEATMAKWNDELNKIRVYGGTEESRVKFYTGLYHALLGRGLASDVNGAYPKNDGSVGQIPLGRDGKPAHNHYNTDAVWGAYWNLETLWALAWPEYYNDFVNSQMLVYNETGWLGDGIAGSRYVSGVGTNMTSIAFAGAYNSGLRDFDVEAAYRAALNNETGWKDRLAGAGKLDVKLFVDKGWIPYVSSSDNFAMFQEGSQFSASHTLEYSFSSYAVAQWAKALGHNDDYEQLMELSKGWSKLFDESEGLVRPRTPDGRFIDNFDPYESWRGFQEGNAMQYTFFVPHDPYGLIEKVGADKFNERLDGIFTQARKSIFGGGKVAYAFSGLQSPYNHGNQPSLHISWLFNFSGKPWLTQKWVRLICDEFYGTDGEHGYGYGQDEDQGQLGAWYVLAGLGLFDVQGGATVDPTFQIGSPLFDRIEIALSPVNAKGKRFVIEASGNGPESYYIQSAEFNGRPFDRNWLYRSELYDGGTLRLEMGPSPAEGWGTSTPPPYSR